MKILAFQSLDSTSTYASQLLDKGAEHPPFAVIARSQISGRGRLGKQWESPEGGLYLTLVLPPELHPNPDKHGSLPLWVAAQTAMWLQTRFGIRATIKWPNDLLFAGRKLAGILCESRLHGNEWGPVLIGIGINLHEAPHVEEQASVSIDEVLRCKTSFDTEELGRSLAEHLLNHVRDSHWLRTYEAFALERDQLWRSESGTYRALKAVTEDGAMILGALGSEEALSISTVSHGNRWIHQLLEPMPLLVADIGNSLCKIAYYPVAKSDEAQIIRLDMRDTDHARQISDYLARIACPKPWVVHTISVASRPREKLGEILRPLGFELVELPKRPLLVDFSHYHFAQLGIDRVALAEAARQQHRNHSVLVVSAGTCITIEAISARGQYLGGYILPGLQTKLNSLHLRTDRLPLLKIYEEKWDAPLPLFGHDTKGAMLSGILHESIALIEYLKNALIQNGNETPHIIVTGGDGEILNRFIGGVYRNDLVLEGVKLMALGGKI
ncbi:MAG: biotin--[acetyl-CoA-carboxylase] ligase [Chitinophagaceae bacterium]|nr:biotin--[acetyl-CoA-carboxylase] ligase [Oligoflexus sp.]